MKKVFIYCRRSSEGEDKQMLSIPSQIKELQEIADRRELHVVEIFQESKSAKAPGRSMFAEMMNRLYMKEADGVLCWKLDRLARNPVDGGTVIWAVKDQKVDIITPSQIYSHENENTLLMYVEFGMAQKFIDDLGKNSQRGMKTKAEMGWYPAPAPLGYKNTPDRKKGFKIIVKDEERFDLVRKMFDEVLSGRQASEVYKDVEENWKITSNGGTVIARSTFYNILGNPFYYGEFEWIKDSGNWYKGNHEPMITKDEFNIVQKMLGKKGKPISRSHVFDLTGLLRCKECGSAITATKKTKHYKTTGNTVTYTYYHCTKKNKDIKCNARPLTEDDLIRQFDKLLASVKPEVEFINWAKKWLSVVHDNQSEMQENVLKSQQSALGSVENRLNKLVDMKLGDLIDDSTYKEKKKDLENEKRDLKEKLEDTDGTLENWRVKVESALDFAFACQKKFEKGTRDEKHEIIMRVGSNLLLSPNKLIDITLKREYKALADEENWDERYENWIEPVEYTDILTKNTDLQPTNPLWLPLVDMFIDREIEYGFAFSDLKTRCELLSVEV